MTKEDQEMLDEYNWHIAREKKMILWANRAIWGIAGVAASLILATLYY